tara:strand:- start:663 stop:1484 length:822 start_codon:yes stop_codon:yes gene_type:complete
MKLIIENGGTKLDWVLLGSEPIYACEGINVFGSNNDISNQIKQIFPQDILRLETLCIDFYTTGFNSIINSKLTRIFQNNFQDCQINIFSDMLAASRALFKFDVGITCILGTGSNCAYFDGFKNNIITPSLGYLMGDYGSGYDLGRKLLIEYFNNNLDQKIHKSIEEKTQKSQEDLLASIYASRHPKNYIASFAKLVKYYENEPLIQDIIQSSFLVFMEKNPYQYSQYQKYHFGFVGSIAFYFQTHISNILSNHNIKAVFLEKPIDSLMSYYLS